MTLTKEQSSNKEMFEASSTESLNLIIRTAMSEGCIRPSHVYDAVDEVLDRLAKVEKVLEGCNIPDSAVIERILKPRR